MTQSKAPQRDAADRVLVLARALADPFVEITHGITSKTFPWGLCFLAASAMCVCFVLRWDRLVFEVLRVGLLYPTNRFAYLTYTHTVLIGIFWAWGAVQTGRRHVLIKHLSETFLACKLQNGLGKLPGYVSDRAVDENTRKLRLTSAGFSEDRFLAVKKELELTLRVHIDSIKSAVGAGTIDILYSHAPMPKNIKLENVRSLPRWTFTVGRTRAKEIRVSLLKVPHLLVAGQTGGGKSTFLGQFITSLYVNHSDLRFTLIDLKGGVEFGLFESLPRASIITSIRHAITELEGFNEKLDRRMALLKEHGAKELEELVKRLARREVTEGDGRKPDLRRHIIVIDEAAEIFLASARAEAKLVQSAKAILSRIARQGRSVGIHLVVATQRPDTRSLDPQVKANLTGVLCFQMANDASSVSVLGNGRATDLLPIPGRAIWKCGAEQAEVQVPYLSTDDIYNLTKEKN